MFSVLRVENQCSEDVVFSRKVQDLHIQPERRTSFNVLGKLVNIKPNLWEEGDHLSHALPCIVALGPAETCFCPPKRTKN